jgi:hypothetical protein
MSAFDAALRGRGAPTGPLLLGSGASQMQLADDWALDVLPAGEWKSPLAGNVGGQWRIQEVLTPDWVLDVAREAFGGSIGLDPCASSNSAEWFAVRNMSLAAEAVPYQQELETIRQEKGSRARQKELTALLKPYYLGGALKCDWGDYRDSCFCNPPYGFLEPWIERLQREGRDTFRRLIGFYPVRTHRSWWMKLHQGFEIVTLNYDVVFKGFEHAFPAALCLASYNVRIPPLGERETGRIKL